MGDGSSIRSGGKENVVPLGFFDPGISGAVLFGNAMMTEVRVKQESYSAEYRDDVLRQPSDTDTCTGAVQP